MSSNGLLRFTWRFIHVNRYRSVLSYQIRKVIKIVTVQPVRQDIGKNTSNVHILSQEIDFLSIQ